MMAFADEPVPLADRIEQLGRGLVRAETPADRPPSPDELDATEWVHAQRLADIEAAWVRRVPRKFQRAAMCDLAGVAVLAGLETWTGDPTRNVVMVGPTGTGKSHAAWAAMRALAFRGHRWAGATAPDLLDSMRPDRTPVVDAGADVVLIDDVGAEKQTEWTIEQLDRIIDTRWAAELPTIVTSNLDPVRLAAWLGDRAWSRLAGGALVLGVTGDDRRFTT